MFNFLVLMFLISHSVVLLHFGPRPRHISIGAWFNGQLYTRSRLIQTDTWECPWDGGKGALEPFDEMLEFDGGFAIGV